MRSEYPGCVSSAATHVASCRNGKLRMRRRADRCAPSEFVALTTACSGKKRSGGGRAARKPLRTEDRGGDERRNLAGDVVEVDRGLRRRRREQIQHQLRQCDER